MRTGVMSKQPQMRRTCDNKQTIIVTEALLIAHCLQQTIVGELFAFNVGFKMRWQFWSQEYKQHYSQNFMFHKLLSPKMLFLKETVHLLIM